MKKIFALASLLSLGFSTAQAQISKGTALIGGFGGYSRYTEEQRINNSTIPPEFQNLESTTSGFNINPSAGFFIVDNIALGLSLGVGRQRYDSPLYNYEPTPGLYEQVTKATDLTIAPFLRYYYLPMENFGFYGQLASGYFSSLYRTKNNLPGTSNPPQKSRSSGVYIGFTPALVFFPTTKIGLELAAGGISYNRTRSRPEDVTGPQANNEIKRSNFAANFGISNLTLGASYYVGRQ